MANKTVPGRLDASWSSKVEGRPVRLDLGPQWLWLTTEQAADLAFKLNNVVAADAARTARLARRNAP